MNRTTQCPLGMGGGGFSYRTRLIALVTSRRSSQERMRLTKAKTGFYTVK